MKKILIALNVNCVILLLIKQQDLEFMSKENMKKSSLDIHVLNVQEHFHKREI